MKKGFELNFRCNECGTGIYNALENYDKCPECGAELEVLAPVKKRVVKEATDIA